MSDSGETGTGESAPCLGHHWRALEAEESEETGAGALSGHAEARAVAAAHLELAEGLWHRPGQGALALAHRLAAAVIFALIGDDSRDWRLSPLVRDVVTLGEEALPASIDALAAVLEDGVEAPFRTLVERLAGDFGVVERRFQEVVGLVSTVAREVAAPP